MPADLLDGVMGGTDPRHQRLFVAGWALSDGGTSAADLEALRAAVMLYERRAPGLLERPTRITVASIVSELEQICAS